MESLFESNSMTELIEQGHLRVFQNEFGDDVVELTESLRNWSDAVLTTAGQSDERITVALWANAVLTTLETYRENTNGAA